MYERFTDRARKVMQLANFEAQRYNHEYIGTEHMLLGLLKEGGGVAYNVLQNLGISLHKIEELVKKNVQPGPDMTTLGKLPQTPRAKRVVEYAIEEARNFNHNYVGTEHLFLGLLREKEGIAAECLAEAGCNLDEVREEIQNMLGKPMEEAIRKLTPPVTASFDSMLAEFEEFSVEYYVNTVNRIRELCDGRLSSQEAYERIKEIMRKEDHER